MKIAEEEINLSRLRINLFKKVFLIWKIFIKAFFNMLVLNSRCVSVHPLNLSKSLISIYMLQ